MRAWVRGEGEPSPTPSPTTTYKTRCITHHSAQHHAHKVLRAVPRQFRHLPGSVAHSVTPQSASSQPSRCSALKSRQRVRLAGPSQNPQIRFARNFGSITARRRHRKKPKVVYESNRRFRRLAETSRRQQRSRNALSALRRTFTILCSIVACKDVCRTTAACLSIHTCSGSPVMFS